MALENAQNIFVGGTRVHLARKTGATTFGPRQDIGTITGTTAPVRSRQTIELRDGSFGIAKKVSERQTQADTTFTIQTANMTPRRWADFLGGDTITIVNQIAAADYSYAVTVFPESVVQILGANGKPVSGITKIESVTIGGTALTAGVDFDADEVDLKLGQIKIYNPSGLTSSGESATIVVDAPVTTYAEFVPGTKLEFEANVWVIHSEGGGADSNAIEYGPMLAKLSGSAAELPQNGFGNITLNASVLEVAGSATPQGLARFYGPRARETR